MTSIPAFGDKLLANPPVKSQNPTKVEDILNATPAPQPIPSDSYVPSQSVHTAPPQKKGGVLAPILTTAAGLGGVFLAGRKGWLGKTVKTWFGGRLSLEKANKKIAGQLHEFMSRYGSVKNVSVEGKDIIKVEMDNGVIREFKRVPKKGDTVIQYESFPSKNRREVINFNREDASPLHRVQFKLDKKGKVKGFVSYKGGDILSKDFDEVSQMYMRSTTKVKPRMWLDFFKLGPVKTVVKTRKFDTLEPEGFWARLKDLFTDSGKNITKINRKTFRGVTTKSTVSNPAVTKTYVYDNSGHIKRVHVKPKTKGAKGYYEHYQYAMFTTPDGSQSSKLINIVRTSDKAGKKPI